jgi:hypothetical protein
MQGPVFLSRPLDSPLEYGYSNLDLPRRGELYARKWRDLSRAGGQMGPSQVRLDQSFIGRDERIRTSGLTHPKGARYPCATSRRKIGRSKGAPNRHYITLVYGHV